MMLADRKDSRGPVENVDEAVSVVVSKDRFITGSVNGYGLVCLVNSSHS